MLILCRFLVPTTGRTNTNVTSSIRITPGPELRVGCTLALQREHLAACIDAGRRSRQQPREAS